MKLILIVLILKKITNFEITTFRIIFITMENYEIIGCKLIEINKQPSINTLTLKKKGKKI